MNRAEWEEKNKKDKSASPNIANSAEPYKFGATTLDVASNILFGAIKGLEGIYDVGATAVGAVGGLFDKEFRQDVKEKVAFDWTGKNIDFGGAVDGSLINRMGEKGQNIVRGVAQGLGQMLPAVGMNALLPGSGLATIATSAAGGGTERAFQDNAEYGKGMLYGAVVGAVEALTEKMTGGFTKGVFGKGFLDDAIEAAINKTSKSALFKVAMNFAEEGFEEMVATAVEPAVRELYQKGAAKETFTKEHAEDILYDGLIGGLTGIVYGGTVGQIGAKSRNVYESAQELKNIDEKKTRLWEKDKLDDTAETKLNAEKEATQLELKKRLAKLSDVKREQLTKRLNLDLDEQGNFRSYEAEDGYNKGAYSPTLHGKESALAYKPVKTELTDAQKSAVKLNSTLNKIMRVKTDVVIAEDLGTTPDGNKIGATFDKGVLYIDSSIDDKTLAKRKVIHEITHSLESLGKTAYTNFRSAMMKAVEENAEVKKLLDPTGNLWQDTIKRYQSQLDGKTAFEQNYIVTTEIMAQYAEVLFTDEKVIERLAQENRTLTQKIYNKIKNYIEYLKQRKENPELANFLRQAEKLYKKALESSAQRSTLTDAKAIGEIMEGKETKTETDDSRKSIDYGDLTEEQYNILSKTTNIEYSKSPKTGNINVYATNKYGNLEYTANFELLSLIQRRLGNKLGQFIFDNATATTQRMSSEEIKKYYTVQKEYNYNDTIQKAKEHFGTTVNINIGAWVNTDGTMLKFGESSNNSRDMDHREIQNVMPYLTGGDAMYKYIELGNIRHMPETGSMEMAHKPTQEQINIIRRIARKNYGEVTIDLWNENEKTFNESDRLTSIEYPEGTKETKIISDIINFYENGTTPKVSPLAEFRYSLDSDGNTLTQAQQEFFKDSKARDEKGNLLKVYHGTPNGKFTVFDKSKQGATDLGFNGLGFYFTPDKDYAKTYGKTVIKAYLNITNPLHLNNKETDTGGALDYYLKNHNMPRDSKSLVKLLNEAKIPSMEEITEYIKTQGYDGVINVWRGENDYIVFKENQIKRTDNLNPTSDNDIRFSLDSDGKKLTQEQIEFFKDSKVLDEKGNLLKVYHGTKAEFTVFDKNKYNQNEDGGDYVGEGFFFAKNSNTAKRYGSKVISAYLNIENPLIINTEEDSKKLRKTFMNAYQNGDQELRDLFGDSGDYDYYTLREENPSIIREELQRRGYDGLIDNMYGQFAVFDSNQIKLTTNENPTADDDIRYSILAADDKTVYDEKKIKDAMTDAIAEQLQLGDYEYGELSKIGEKEMMKLFADEIKQSKNKEATAKKVAEFIVENAVVENAGDFTGVTMQDINTYNSLKNYLHKFNLNAIKDEIKYRFDKDKSVFARFGARKGQISFTADVIAQELESSGIFFKGINEADLFFEFVDMYKQYSDMIHKRVKDNRRLFMHNMNGFMVDKIIEDLAKDILRIIENEGRPAVPKDIAKVKNAEIKELDAKIKAMAEEIARMENEAGEQTEKSAKMREELWVMDHNYDRLNLELKEDKDFINSMVAIHKLAKEDIRRISNKLADTQKRHRAEMALFERIDRVKNLTQYMGAGVQLADEVIGLIKLLKKQKTWRGKLTADIRDIMKTYARKTDGVPLYDLLSQDENLYAEEIQAIANGQGELTTAEIITLKDVLDKFVHDVREYDRVYWQGEKAHATEVGANLIEETRKTIPFKKGWLADEWRKIDNALEAPYWRFMRLSNYDDNGIMAKMFWELKDALNKRDGFSMKVVKHFEEFYKKNQKLVDSWRDTVDINGVKISKGQAMALYLSSFREQMQNHLYNQTENIVTDKEIFVIRKGTIKLVDEKKALKSMREAFENATEQKITEEWVQGLLSQFNAEEREYMRLVHDFFNVISAEAKTETDFALNGIRGDLEKHYFPIRVASDQIFKKIGDKMFMDLFTVYKPSFTKKVVKNAKNMVVIENITDVVNRHARQMADYYGFAVVMKTFTRIWNAKTENGTARQAVQKVDPLFEKYVDKLFKDMQHNVPEREGFDKLVSKFMGWGATAALAANPKVWVNQMVALFAGHGIGIKYSSLMKGLKNALKQKGDYSTMFENSPFLFARFNDGFNVASGALLEKKGLFGKASKLTELTLRPIEYMDKLMIAGVWNAAMIDSNNDVKKAAELTEKAVIITQQNFTPLFRPEILRTNSSLLRLSTMFMSEPLQMFSQLFGSIDRRRVAKKLKKQAKTAEEHAKADQLLAEANQKMKFAFTTITVDLILLTLIAQAFSWIKGKDDEEKFAVGFGKELLSNFIGMFPFLRDAYSVIEGYDVTNMAYTGLTNITNAGKEIFTSVSDAVQGKYQSGQEISAGIRKTIIGLSQTFGIPVRNIESYVKGIVEKVSPSAGETYESWFWKKSDAEYQKVLDEALEKGNDRLADTVIDLMLKKRLTVDNDTVTKELKALYKTGQQVVPSIVQPTITHNGESIELSARDYKQFVDVYSQANKEAETLIQSQAYRVLNDTVKADAVKLIYDYFYNLAKSELVGESTARYIDLTGIPEYKLAIILAQTKNLTADKDEQGKSISGTKKYKVERALVGLYLTQAQKQKIMEYLGYAI